jgi:hypothetical protein
MFKITEKLHSKIVPQLCLSSTKVRAFAEVAGWLARDLRAALEAVQGYNVGTQNSGPQRLLRNVIIYSEKNIAKDENASSKSAAGSHAVSWIVMGSQLRVTTAITKRAQRSEPIIRDVLQKVNCKVMSHKLPNVRHILVLWRWRLMAVTDTQGSG